MRPTTVLMGLLLIAAPAVVAQRVDDDDLPDLSSQSQPNGNSRSTAAPSTQGRTTAAAATSTAEPEKTKSETRATSAFTGISIPPTTTAGSPTSANADPAIHLSGLPTIAGVGIPDQKVPDTAAAPFMQKSNLPDGTVFICVGAVLAFLGAAVLAWRGLVAWSLHRSVKRAARAQNLADLKAMSAVPGKKRGLYNVVGASSNMSLDRLSAAPTGTSKPTKPFASPPTGTPPKSTSLFFSATAGGATGLRDSVVNRSSNYLPAGYYPTGSAQPASGSPMTHVGGPHLSTNSLATPGNRFSARSGVSPPGSPSLPPSRGYDRAPPSRDGVSIYQRNSVATLGNPGNTRSGVYSNEQGSMSQLSLNVPGGTTAPGGRAPSAYLEDLFENHGTGPSPQPR